MSPTAGEIARYRRYMGRGARPADASPLGYYLPRGALAALGVSHLTLLGDGLTFWSADGFPVRLWLTPWGTAVHLGKAVGAVDAGTYAWADGTGSSPHEFGKLVNSATREHLRHVRGRYDVRRTAGIAHVALESIDGFAAESYEISRGDGTVFRVRGPIPQSADTEILARPISGGRLAALTTNPIKNLILWAPEVSKL